MLVARRAARRGAPGFPDGPNGIICRAPSGAIQEPTASVETVAAVPAHPSSREPALRVACVPVDSPFSLEPHVLGAVAFGARARLPDDPRVVRVGLEPCDGIAACELWYGVGPVRSGRDGAIRHADDGVHQFAVIEVDEREHGGIAGAAEHAYRELWRFKRETDFPCPLRIWNFLDAINEGEGDDERYRHFVVGRAHALQGDALGQYPAATAIGRRDGSPILQVFWLAARDAGLALENPRQVSAYRYPRRYGPVAPGFSRAMLSPGFGLLISGTASVVGHASRHVGDPERQLGECLDNLDCMLARGAEAEPALAGTFDARSALKMYVRDPAVAPRLAALLAERVPDVPALVLAGDVCRSELLVELEAAQPL